MKKTKKYAVAILFNGDGSRGTVYAGTLNGASGSMENDEEPREGVLRKIEEGTPLFSGDIECFTWLGNLTIPASRNPKNSGAISELVFCSGIVKDEVKARDMLGTAKSAGWYDLDGDGVPGTNVGFADGDDLLYFISLAKRMLFAEKQAGVK